MYTNDVTFHAWLTSIILKTIFLPHFGFLSTRHFFFRFLPAAPAALLRHICADVTGAVCAGCSFAFTRFFLETLSPRVRPLTSSLPRLLPSLRCVACSLCYLQILSVVGVGTVLFMMNDKVAYHAKSTNTQSQSSTMVWPSFVLQRMRNVCSLLRRLKTMTYACRTHFAFDVIFIFQH